MAQLSRIEFVEALIERIRSDIQLLSERIGSQSSTAMIPKLEETIQYLEKFKSDTYAGKSLIVEGAIVDSSCGGERLIVDRDLKLYGGFNPDLKPCKAATAHLRFFKGEHVAKVGDSYKVYIGQPGEEREIVCKIVGIR